MNRMLLLGALFGASVAHADTIPCSPVKAGTIAIDGLLTDWQGESAVTVDRAGQVVSGRSEWSGPQDLSFDLYCNHDERTLYLAFMVRDEYLVRSRKPAGDDHLVIELNHQRLLVYPADLKKEIPGRVTVGARGRAKGLKMAEAMQRGGYSVELAVPLRRIPGYRAGAPSIRFGAHVADCDASARLQTDTLMGVGGGRGAGTQLVFAQAEANLEAFLKDRNLRRSDIRSDTTANVAGDRRAERVLLVGRTIGILGDGLPGGGYFYFDLPAKSGSDVRWLKLKDLSGDGKAELLVRYQERSESGRRELVAVYRFNDAERFSQQLAQEVWKGEGERVVQNRMTIKPRRGKRGHAGGADLLFDKPTAKGYSEKTYREAPASDCFPILLPWGEEQRRQFSFEGDEFFQK